ncbi:hypothetical protein MKY96_32790 [Paenibacillus sp. FSL R7-0302]|uniref:hypothetical protein n=1 Tax=Paenibacillus sp. FSL R7-0302 TaxID=2921681 RepID=UPI0030FBA6A2
MKFYATGSKQVKEVVDGEKVTSTKSILIDLQSETRVLAVQEAEQAARKGKITLDGVYTAKNYRHDAALPMTKSFKERKKKRAGVRKLSFARL